MRLLSIDARQVGHFHAGLRFRLSPRLTVVLGDNEAGKSTLRRAIRALLFGPDKALAAPLTVGGFEIAAEVSSGGSIHVLQRKRRVLQGGLPVALAALIAESNAGRFASLFDLAHDNLLPESEAEFLQADGVLGSLMFGARTGVSPVQLQDARAQIARNLEELKSRRAGNNGVPTHVERYRAAAERHAGLARFERSDDLEEKQKRLDAQVRRLDEEIQRLEAEARRLQALAESAEDVECVARDHSELRGLVSARPPLSVAAATDLSAMFRRMEERSQAATEAQTEYQRVSDEHEAADVPGDLYTLWAQCDAMRDEVAKLEPSEEMLATLRDRHRQKSVELIQLLDRLGVPTDGQSESVARQHLRPEPFIAHLEDLLQQHARLCEALRERQARLFEARRRLEKSAEDSDDVAGAPIEALDPARPLLADACKLEARIRELCAGCADADADLRQRRATLGVVGEDTNPYGLPLPSFDSALEAEEALSETRASVERLEAELDRLMSEREAAEHRLAGQRRQVGSVASPEDIGQARLLRDEHLDALVRTLESDTASSLPALAGHAVAVRQLVRQADLLVDRRMEVGEALGQLRSEEVQLAKLSESVETASSAVASGTEAIRAQRQALVEMWPFLRAPPRSTAAWHEHYEAWRAAWDAQQRRVEEITQCEGRLAVVLEDARAMLADTLPIVREFKTAEAMSETVARERELRRERASRIEERRKQHENLVAERRTAQEGVADADAALRDWQAKWDAASHDFPDRLSPQPAAVERWIDLQGELRRLLSEIEGLSCDAHKQSSFTAERRARIESLVAEARVRASDLEIPDGIDLAAIFAVVEDACRTSKQRLDHRRALADRLQLAETRLMQAREAQGAAVAALSEAWATAGMTGESSRESIDALSLHAGEVERLREAISRREERLRGRFGDGMAAAISRLQQGSLSTIEAERRDLEAGLAHVRTARDAAADERRDVRKAIEDLREGADAGVVTQEFIDAREALFHCLEERYRLTVAQVILDRAYRDATDSGRFIEEEASRYFHRLSGGAYAGLRIDHDTPDEPTLVAVESPRVDKSLEELSAGTRDQVWLALRLAGVLAAANDTPFPLLLDDSLVQFDDARASAALQVLHEVSEHVQVILFTHHDHVAALAEAVVPADDLGVVVLPSLTGTMRDRSAALRTASRRPRPGYAADQQAFGEAAGLVDPGDLPDREAGSRVSRDDAEAVILEILADATEPLGKSSIIESATGRGLDLSGAWTATIAELTGKGLVLQEGQRKGAKYRLPG